MGAGIGNAYKEAMRWIADTGGGTGGYSGINGGCKYCKNVDGTDRIFEAYFHVGNGVVCKRKVKGKKELYRDLTANYYTIRLYNGSPPTVLIHKATARSIVDKEFSAGPISKDLFKRYDPEKDNDSFRHILVYSDMHIDEVLSALVKKPWTIYANVALNPYNLKFLELGQEHMVKVLLFHGLIIKHKGKYMTMDEYDFKKSIGTLDFH